MKNENLTQEEATRRSELLTVHSYDVHVDLTNAADANFTSYPTATTVKFAAHEGESTFIDYIHHAVDSIKLNGTLLNIHDVIDGSRINLPNLQKENILTIHGSSLYSRSGEGMHRYFDPADGKVYLYTQYEPADCRRVFPNFEQPDLKAEFNFRITAPKNWIVSSNAELEKTLEDPADSNISKRVFKPTAKISTYITTILAGEYFAVNDMYHPASQVNSGSIPLVAYCRQSLKEHFDYENIFTITKNGLDFFQDLFDYPYPYPKYEQAFVPEYNLGAMENPGMVTFTESYLFESGATEAQLEGRANVICHEMSHMWFGDLVTMKWWNDLWLKESFAEYMGTLGAEQAAKFDESWVTFANRRKAWAYGQDQLPTTHPIVADIPHLEAARQNFDGITYAKGSSVLKQLVAYVGFETFIEAARVYFKRFEWGNTTLQDFLEVLNEVSDRDVLAWSAAWLETMGLSTLTTERVFDDKNHLEALLIKQELPPSVPTELGRPHQFKIQLFTEKSEKLIPTDTISVEFPAGATSEISVDLTSTQREAVANATVLLLNAEDLTYAKTILSEADGRAKAIELVSTIDDALSRGLIWGSLWNQVRDGQLHAKDYVKAVCAHASREHSATLLFSITQQAQSAIAYYTPEQNRQPLWDCLYQGLSKALENAEAGSDEQLILVRAMLSVASRTSAGLDFARKVSAGAQQRHHENIPGVSGVNLSQTLGWSALVALATQCQVTVEELQSYRDGYQSAIADRGLALAKASIPDPAIKREAFTDVIESADLSNDQLSATAEGFQAGPSEMHSPYIKPYFEQLLDTWDKRSIGMASRVVLGLFPLATIQSGSAEKNPVTIQAQQWLENNPQAPTALRRLILEEKDNAERFLTAQQYNLAP